MFPNLTWHFFNMHTDVGGRSTKFVTNTFTTVDKDHFDILSTLVGGIVPLAFNSKSTCSEVTTSATNKGVHNRSNTLFTNPRFAHNACTPFGGIIRGGRAGGLYLLAWMRFRPARQHSSIADTKLLYDPPNIRPKVPPYVL